MVYKNIVAGRFVDRPNRFVAHVEINGVVETVHVKNTGRCRELLLPGVKVILEIAANPDRKTKYDLIAVYKQGFGLINMDSQAPNKVVAEWLAGEQGRRKIKIAIEVRKKTRIVVEMGIVVMVRGRTL